MKLAIRVILAFATTLTASMATAQSVGSTVFTNQVAPLKVGNETVSYVSNLTALQVNEKQGPWLWVTDGSQSGWLHSSYVATSFRASDSGNVYPQWPGYNSTNLDRDQVYSYVARPRRFSEESEPTRMYCRYHRGNRFDSDSEDGWHCSNIDPNYAYEPRFGD